MENEATTDIVHIPTTLAQFEDLYKTIIGEYGFPDMPGYKNAVATQILHLPQDTTEVSKKKFASVITKFQANEIAFEVVQNCKKEAQAEEARLKQEATQEGESAAEPKLPN